MPRLDEKAEQAGKALLDRGGKYLTFALGPEEYGLEILKVREIIGYMEITAVPRTPHEVKGVINLRGQVIPVVDHVQEVLDIDGQDIEEAPQFGSSVDTSFFLGMGKIGDSVKILLDIDRVLGNGDLAESTEQTEC